MTFQCKWPQFNSLSVTLRLYFATNWWLTFPGLQEANANETMVYSYPFFFCCVFLSLERHAGGYFWPAAGPGHSIPLPSARPASRGQNEGLCISGCAHRACERQPLQCCDSFLKPPPAELRTPEALSRVTEHRHYRAHTAVELRVCVWTGQKGKKWFSLLFFASSEFSKLLTLEMMSGGNFRSSRSRSAGLNSCLKVCLPLATWDEREL